MAKKPTTTDAGAENAGTDLALLSPEQRAEQALSFQTTREKLQALAQESTGLVRVDTEDNLAAAKAAKTKLQQTRVRIERTGKAARDDANKFGKAVIAKERELISIIAPEEERLGELVLLEQRRREEAERVAREEEERRANLIRESFARLRALPGMAASLDVAGIDDLIAEAQKVVDDQSAFPEDLRAAARYEAQVAQAACKAARDRRVQADRDAAELEELRREKAAREEQERRAAANRAEAARATQVVEANADDDDLPPRDPLLDLGKRQAVMPREVARAIPESVTVPVRRVLPLLTAARAALALLQQRGLGGEPAALDLAEALEDADHG